MASLVERQHWPISFQYVWFTELPLANHDKTNTLLFYVIWHKMATRGAMYKGLLKKKPVIAALAYTYYYCKQNILCHLFFLWHFGLICIIPPLIQLSFMYYVKVCSHVQRVVAAKQPETIYFQLELATSSKREQPTRPGCECVHIKLRKVYEKKQDALLDWFESTYFTHRQTLLIWQPVQRMPTGNFLEQFYLTEIKCSALRLQTKESVSLKRK